MSKPVILLDAGELVALPGANDGDVLTWNGTTGAWQSSPGGGVGTVTSVALSTGVTGLTVSGGTSQTITGAGTFTLGGTLGAGYGGTGLGAPVAGDAGKVLAATAGGGYELVANGNGTVTSVTAGAGLSGGVITTSGTISMPNVGTAGAYGSASSVPVITTDTQGRVTGVVPTAIAIAQSAVANLVSDLAGKVPTNTQVIAGTGLSGGGALSGNVTLSLPSVGTQGEYGSASSVAVVTTDQQGRVSAATTTAIDITQSQVQNLTTDLGAKADKSVTATAGTGLTGGGTLGANFSFALDTVGTAQTSLGSASKTVTISTDAYGRVTALSEQAISGLAASVISSGQLGLAQGGTGIDASSVTGGQLLVGGTGAFALQSVSGDASLASSGAMTVTGLQTNPVAAGSLGLPDAGKALIWSGSAWQAAAIPGGGGGSGGLTLYCNYAASSPYVLDTAFDEHAQWSTGAVTVANDANGTELARFLTPTSFVVEVIPAGIWDLNVYVQASGSTNDTAIRAKVGIWNGSTLTVLGTSDYTYVSDPTVLTQYKASVYVPTYDVASGERIAIIIEGRRFAATTQTVTSYFGVGAISHVHSTLNAPGGTGLVKVVNGYLQSPASLLVNADVADTAAIAVSKLAAGTNTYVLTTVGGVPTWSAPAAGGVSSLTGTADQVLVNGTAATPQTGALTLTLPQSIGTGSSPSFAGLTLSGLSDGIVKAVSGVLSGGGSVALGSEVSGTLAVGNGGTGITSAGASGNLLVSDGSAFASVAMSGDATFASTGVLTLKNTGTAGTYGSASAVPVFQTDAQGRVTSVTNTNIDFAGNAVTSITGTANQVSVTGTVGNVTLSLPSTLSPTAASTATAFTIRGGAGSGSGSNGANLYLYSGAPGAPAGRFGDVYIDANDLNLSGLSGKVYIGTQYANEIQIGIAGNANYLNGAIRLTNYSGYVKANGTNAISASATIPTSDISGILSLSNGGTGASLSPSAGCVVYANGTTLALTGTGASGSFLKSNGTSAPSFELISTIDINGVFGIAKGGTNNGSLSVAQGTVYYGDGSKLVGLAPGTSGQFLQTQGANADPQWAATTTPYDLSGEFVGTPASGAVIMRFVAARAFTFGGTAYFACATAPASTATFTMNVNGVSKGTVTIATSATSGTGTITSTSIAAGDLITVVATTPAAITSPYWTLPGTV